MAEVTLSDIEDARERFDETVVQRTEIERSRSLSEMTGAEVYLKMEHLQRTGSFKTRGAYNKLQQVAERGSANRVVAASAGNHAQGVALAATKTGIDSTIVMPENAPQAKVEATRGYGAGVELRGEDFRAAMEHAQSLTEADDTEFVHAYDDPAIVAGQGTIGLEIHEEMPEVDTVVVPIGGGRTRPRNPSRRRPGRTGRDGPREPRQGHPSLYRLAEDHRGRHRHGRHLGVDARSHRRVRGRSRHGLGRRNRPCGTPSTRTRQAVGRGGGGLVGGRALLRGPRCGR